MSPSPDATTSLEREHNHRLIETMRMHLSTTSGLLEISDAIEGSAGRTPEQLLEYTTLQLNLPDEGPVIQRTDHFRAAHQHPLAPAGHELKFLVTHTLWADPSRPVVLEAQMLVGNCFEDSPAVPFTDREEFLDVVDNFMALCAAGEADLHPTCV